MAHADKASGVAPLVQLVTYTSGTWTPPAGRTCVGFYVGATSGNVVFASGPYTNTYPVIANSYHSAEVNSITQAGSVPSIWALLI